MPEVHLPPWLPLGLPPCAYADLPLSHLTGGSCTFNHPHVLFQSVWSIKSGSQLPNKTAIKLLRSLPPSAGIFPHVMGWWLLIGFLSILVVHSMNLSWQILCLIASTIYSLPPGLDHFPYLAAYNECIPLFSWIQILVTSLVSQCYWVILKGTSLPY